MLATFAAGTLIVLGAAIATLGFVLAGNLTLVLVGLGSVALGGVIGLFAQRQTA